jgi:hypothetical protein
MLAMLVSWPFFSYQTILGHDIPFHLTRIESLKEGLLLGQFPVRLNGLQLNGYGTMDHTMYPHLFLYVPAVLSACGLPTLIAYNVMGILLNIVTVFATWWAFRNLISDRFAAMLATSIYACFLYRLVDLFSRSAVGEAWSMAFFPMALVSFSLLCQGKKEVWLYVLLSWSAILQSHIISSLFLVISAAAVFAFHIMRDGIRVTVWLNWKYLIFTASGLLFLNVWFYGPWLYSYFTMSFPMKGVVHSTLSGATFKNPLSFQWLLGIPFLIMTIVLIGDTIHCSIAMNSVRCFWKDRKSFMLLLLGLVFTFAMSPHFPWKMFDQVFSFMQFPFRLMMLSSICLSVWAGIRLSSWLRPSHYRKVIASFLILAMLALNFSILKHNELSGEFTSGNKTSFGLNKSHFSPQALSDAELPIDYLNPNYSDYTYRDDEPLVRKKWIKSVRQVFPRYTLLTDTTIISYEQKHNLANILYQATSDGYITLPMIYYPGYMAHDEDGKGVKINETIPAHQMKLLVMAGNHTIHVRYEPPYWYSVLDWIAVITLLFLAFQYCYECKKRESNRI